MPEAPNAPLSPELEREASRVTLTYHELARSKVITLADLKAAGRMAISTQRDIETILVDALNIPLSRIGVALADHWGRAYEPYRPERKMPAHLYFPPHDYLRCSELQYLFIDETDDGKIVVVSPDPRFGRGGTEVLQKGKLKKRDIRITTRREFQQMLEAFACQLPGFAKGRARGSEKQPFAPVNEKSSTTGSPELDAIIIAAKQQNCSDIHFEARSKKDPVTIRVRRDGEMEPFREVPYQTYGSIVNVVHILSKRTQDPDKPVDGKFAFSTKDIGSIELRAAIIPTVEGGKSMVLRILAGGAPIPMANIGLSERNLASIKSIARKPYGLFLVCGPTGSGKTTTLHSILHHLNTPDKKIWTAEDPVEITQSGISQVEMKPLQELTFAFALRAFLRADPDVIMVGEMRDEETARIGVVASLTGHLVLSTLHTNSAPESVSRLFDMGVDPFPLGDALLGVLAQRLVRRLCEHCRRPRAASPEELDHLLREYGSELERTQAWKADGEAMYAELLEEWKTRFAKSGEFVLHERGKCEACRDSGYKGRIGLHELLTVNDDIKRAIQHRARAAEILTMGLEIGMRTLRQDGIEKVLAGETDLEQVDAVCAR